jgi:Putative Ig domain
MRLHLKVLLIAGALLTAGLGTSASADAATPAPPTLNTSNFACSNGVCEVGPGNVGMPFAAGLRGTGGPAYTGPECNPYIMKVVSGRLPPGLQFGEPVCEWTITGTPTQAGTYSFTVQITPQPNNLGQSAGPSGTQQLTITIGTGGSDRLVITAAVYNGHQFRLYVDGFDVNVSALYSVSVTSTGKVIIPAQPNRGASDDGFLALTAGVPDPCGTTHSCSVTVTDSLGSSVTATVPPTKY